MYIYFVFYSYFIGIGAKFNKFAITYAFVTLFCLYKFEIM